MDLTRAHDALQIASRMHEDTNHKYGETLPYSFHLAMAGQIALKYKHFIPEEDFGDVLAAVYLHDTIEDTRQSYNDIKKMFGTSIADMVWSVTDNSGRNRKERKNFQRIRDNKYGSFIKLCDRIANVLAGFIEGSTNQMYWNEFEEFHNELYTITFDKMWTDLENLLRTKTWKF